MGLLFTGDWLPRQVSAWDSLWGKSLVVGNLECAFADGLIDCGKAYTSILPQSCLDNILSSGFAALSVANNHVNDAGNFRETYAELTRRFPSIQFFGTIEKPYAVFTNVEKDQQAIIIGCLEPCRSRGNFIFKQEDVTSLICQLRSSTSNLQPSTCIYVYPHWGKEGEYTSYPAPWQLKLAREWIDAGANGVFGSHSHVPQGRETYKGKPIYYSLGNFDFDHPESRLYVGTEDRLVVEVENGMHVKEIFDSEKARQSVERASVELIGWNMWKWAKKVGPFNLKKNTASWHLRLKKNFLKTLPKFVAWQFLPKTILFRIAALCR